MELIQAKGDTWYLAAAELIPIYRLEGGRCILLDSGLESEREELAAALDRAGLTPVGVFGSHTHRDHSVNTGWLRERYGARICLPEGEAVIASTPLMCKQVYASLSLEGLMEDCGGMVCRADETVGPEDGTAEFLGVPFRVLHAPGHTPDHICTITPDGVCYTADLMLAGPALETARLPYHYVHAVARASMEKLRDAAGGCACCIAAHRAVFRDPASVAAGNLALLDRVGGEMLELLRTPLTLGELVAAVVERKKLLTHSEMKAARYARSVQCFVEYLRDTGRLDVVVDRGMRRFVRR